MTKSEGLSKLKMFIYMLLKISPYIIKEVHFHLTLALNQHTSPFHFWLVVRPGDILREGKGWGACGGAGKEMEEGENLSSGSFQAPPDGDRE